MRFFLVFFLLVPVVELWLMIRVGTVIGALPTVALVLLTAVAGIALLRRQGLSTLMRGNRKLDRGELPAQEMVEAVLLAVSGVMLLLPGFVTDSLGLLGLMPWTRQWLARKAVGSGAIRAFGWSETRYRGDVRDGTGTTFEGEYWRREDRDRLP